MSRVPYPTRDQMPAADREAYDRMLHERGGANVFLAIANAPNLLDDFLTFTAAMKGKAEVDPRLRELCIVMVGHVSGATYEVAHHSRAALAAGVRQSQLSALDDFETSSEFDETERAVLRYTKHVTLDLHVPDSAWHALTSAVGIRQAMDIVFAAAWYNAVARILLPLEIEIESNVRAVGADAAEASADR